MGQLIVEPLTVSELYLNVGHIYLRAILSKYMNTYQWCMMPRDTNRNLPKLKYHNDRGRLGLRCHINILRYVFAVLEVAGSPITSGYKLLHLTDIIINEILSTGAVSHFVSIPELTWDFRSEATHVVTTPINLKLICTCVNDQGVSRCLRIGGFNSVGGKNQ